MAKRLHGCSCGQFIVTGIGSVISGKYGDLVLLKAGLSRLWVSKQGSVCDSRCLSRSCARHPVQMKTGQSYRFASHSSRGTKDFPTQTKQVLLPR